MSSLSLDRLVGRDDDDIDGVGVGGGGGMDGIEWDEASVR